MTKNNLFADYLSQIHQRVDWLVTTCSSSYNLPVAKEQARNHLNTSLSEILKEIYELGYVAGEKESMSYYIQKNKVGKYKMEEKLRVELKKEILDIVLKEYGLKDEKIKKKVIKRVIGENNDESTMEEGISGEEV